MYGLVVKQGIWRIWIAGNV